MRFFRCVPRRPRKGVDIYSRLLFTVGGKGSIVVAACKALRGRAFRYLAASPKSLFRAALNLLENDSQGVAAAIVQDAGEAVSLNIFRHFVSAPQELPLFLR